jgi:hypothetical protein
LGNRVSNYDAKKHPGVGHGDIAQGEKHFDPDELSTSRGLKRNRVQRAGDFVFAAAMDAVMPL